MIERINAHQFLTDANRNTVFRACWHILTQKGVANVAIDLARNRVHGSVKGRFLAGSETYSAHIELRAEGILVSIFCATSRAGNAPSNATERKVVDISRAVELLLESGFQAGPEYLKGAMS